MFGHTTDSLGNSRGRLLMLPVYQAISYIETITKGGRTTPWVVMVDTGKGVKQFVVKFFQREQEGAGLLNQYLRQLKEHGFDTDKERIVQYLNAAKLNSVNFVNNLKGTII